MKVLKRLLIGLCFIYILFWSGLAAYFSYAERHKGLLEANLSRVFGRAVVIDEVKTVWRGLSPRVQINGFNVASDVTGESALSFESISAELSPSSLLLLWPRFTEFAVERPLVEIVSLGAKKVQVAGIKIKPNSSPGFNPKRLISWLLNHESAAWHNGEVVWRRLDGEVQRYSDISFVYQRIKQNRNFTAAATTPKGSLAFQSEINGDPFSEMGWDASLEILGDQGKRILSSEDLSLNVQDGNGLLKLKTLDVERIRDLILLTGFADDFNWLLEAQLTGRLHDMEFGFSGPLLGISSWSLAASASDMGFKSTGQTPAMNNLRGQLTASADGGQFLFFTQNSLFEWGRWFDQQFPISRAQGEFAWRLTPGGEVVVSLTDGEIVDANARVFNINASCKFDRGSRKVSNFAELFTVESVANLDYQDGAIVDVGPQVGERATPLIVDASAEFEMSSLAAIHRYLPNDKRIDKFRTWAENAFVAGQGTNGKASYRGELSKNAIYVGKAELEASADFEGVEIDYGYQRSWPKVNQARGQATLKNSLLSITPEIIFLDKYPLSNSGLQIIDLFRKGRYLSLNGEVSMSLPEGMDFLFKGPLIAPDKIPDQLPITADKGEVDINVDVTIPLNKITDAKVDGVAQVRNGRCTLPPNVPIENVNATVQFTEKSVASDNITALFLGGNATARLVTTEQAQPPVMRLTGSGVAHTESLEPWLGEHLLTWFDGKAPWSGDVFIDGANVKIESESNLEGISVSAPAPLTKVAEQPSLLTLSMVAGGASTQQKLIVNYGDIARAHLESAPTNSVSPRGSALPRVSYSLLDKVLVSVGEPALQKPAVLNKGVYFDIQQENINLDQWLSAIIDLAEFEPKIKTDNTEFLDAMRNVNISAKDPFFLGRPFGALELSAISVDGAYWIGTLNGDNISGTMKIQPRAQIGNYEVNLSYLNLTEQPESKLAPETIDYGLDPGSYPVITLDIDRLRLAGKSLGKLALRGEPSTDKWLLSKFDMTHRGIKTTASGEWVNDEQSGSISSFDFDTKIDEAEGVLDDMAFDGFIKKGKGTIKGNVNWLGAPHEFEYARLNGDFDIRIADGELVKVEPGGGKLLGLLNFNAIARRITLDFRDVFASGLKFDRMQYTGLFSEGEAIMRDAFIFTPAVFVRMEGKVNLHKELIDMEIHMSPELGGNLALLSALANPAAGAVVFITQRIFKDEMRNSSFRSFRALGTWEDFEMVEFDAGREDPDTRPTNTKPAAVDAVKQ